MPCLNSGLLVNVKEIPLIRLSFSALKWRLLTPPHDRLHADVCWRDRLLHADVGRLRHQLLAAVRQVPVNNGTDRHKHTYMYMIMCTCMAALNKYILLLLCNAQPTPSRMITYMSDCIRAHSTWSVFEHNAERVRSLIYYLYMYNAGNGLTRAAGRCAWERAWAVHQEYASCPALPVDTLCSKKQHKSCTCTCGRVTWSYSNLKQ